MLSASIKLYWLTNENRNDEKEQLRVIWVGYMVIPNRICRNVILCISRQKESKLHNPGCLYSAKSYDFTVFGQNRSKRLFFCDYRLFHFQDFDVKMQVIALRIYFGDVFLDIRIFQHICVIFHTQQSNAVLNVINYQRTTANTTIHAVKQKRHHLEMLSIESERVGAPSRSRSSTPLTERMRPVEHQQSADVCRENCWLIHAQIAFRRSVCATSAPPAVWRFPIREWSVPRCSMITCVCMTAHTMA